MSRWAQILGAVLLVAAPTQAVADSNTPTPFDQSATIAYSQAAIGRTLGDYSFLDTRRRTVRLSDYLGKPLVVNMVFTACTDSCPVVVQTLQKAVVVAQEAVGKDAFSVVTIGFDARDDTPERMRAFAYSQGVDLPNWVFLSGDAATVDGLVENLGFIYFPSPRGFDHLAQTTVIDADGRIYRQVYGAQFNAPALVEPLIDLAFGRPTDSGVLADLVNRIRLFCTYYDPTRERYRFDYSIFIGLAVGASSLIGIGVVLVRAWLKARPNARNA
ncbi:MAG: SCO family protein [Alphaproteobacteria bacterium]